MLVQAVALWAVCMLVVVFGLAGCSVIVNPPPRPAEPPYLVLPKCDMGMLRMTKPMNCVDELHRQPLWGLS
ncbi:MAG: hypothetical protein ABI671_12105 [Burkholderiales bacterium]